MPPINHKGETVGYYAENDSTEWQGYMDDPHLRHMPARFADSGEDLGVTLFVRDQRKLGMAAAELLELEGITNTMVDFLRPDAAVAESGSYTLKLYRRNDGS